MKFIFLERRRIRFNDPSSSAPTGPIVSRWSDNTPSEYEQKEDAEFGTPVAASQPPQYNTVSFSIRAIPHHQSLF